LHRFAAEVVGDRWVDVGVVGPVGRRRARLRDPIDVAVAHNPEHARCFGALATAHLVRSGCADAPTGPANA